MVFVYQEKTCEHLWIPQKLQKLHRGLMMQHAPKRWLSFLLLNGHKRMYKQPAANQQHIHRKRRSHTISFYLSSVSCSNCNTALLHLPPACCCTSSAACRKSGCRVNPVCSLLSILSITPESSPPSRGPAVM